MSRANASAFPSHGSMGEVVQTGLTIREHFAAMAMQALIATGKYADVHSYDCVSIGATAVAKRAAICADALIAELSK